MTLVEIRQTGINLLTSHLGMTTGMVRFFSRQKWEQAITLKKEVNGG